MAIHCFDVVYSPNASMDSYLSSWMTSWSGWSKEELTGPTPLEFTDIETQNTVSASGFQQNRFELQNDKDTATVTGSDLANNELYVSGDITGNVVGGETFQVRAGVQGDYNFNITDFSYDSANDRTVLRLESLDEELTDGMAFFSQYIVSNLIGEVGYLASYCDWWIVRAHVCDHDQNERRGCGSWFVVDSSNNYSGQTDVPAEVPQ